jgi:hypothetical protein
MDEKNNRLLSQSKSSHRLTAMRSQLHRAAASHHASTKGETTTVSAFAAAVDKVEDDISKPPPRKGEAVVGRRGEVEVTRGRRHRVVRSAGEASGPRRGPGLVQPGPVAGLRDRERISRARARVTCAATPAGNPIQFAGEIWRCRIWTTGSLNSHPRRARPRPHARRHPLSSIAPSRPVVSHPPDPNRRLIEIDNSWYARIAESSTCRHVDGALLSVIFVGDACLRGLLHLLSLSLFPLQRIEPWDVGWGVMGSCVAPRIGASLASLRSYCC